MHDRPKSTAPIPDRLVFERFHGFREVTLSYFEPEDAAAMRRTARLMYELATDCHYGPRPESSTHQRQPAPPPHAPPPPGRPH